MGINDNKILTQRLKGQAIVIGTERLSARIAVWVRVFFIAVFAYWTSSVVSANGKARVEPFSTPMFVQEQGHL